MSRPTINEAIGMYERRILSPRGVASPMFQALAMLIEAAKLVATFDPDVVLRDAAAAEIKKCQSHRCTCSSAAIIHAVELAWWREVERIEGEPNQVGESE